MRTSKGRLLLVCASALVWSGSASILLARELSFEDRVKAQQALEQVEWSHRVWPTENPQPKPRFEQTLSQAAIQSKVDEYLRKSKALESIWGEPITAAQLQAEVERMARDTREPAILAELFSALGDDPFLIAECLARPVLADRLVRERYVSDAQSQGEAIPQPSEMTVFQRWWEQARVSLSSEISLPPGAFLPVAITAASTCQNDTWQPTSQVVAERIDHAAVWTGNEMIVWGGCTNFGGPYNIGSRYSPSTDSWTVTSQPAPGSIGGCGSSAIWTGSRMIVWGGGSPGEIQTDWNTGGRYDPASNTWAPTSTGPGVPSARYDHTAVWTGSRMIVWGGESYESGPPGLDTGGQYDPVSDSWTPTNTGGVCSGGTNNGMPCLGAADCPGTCSGGAVPGAACSSSDPGPCAGACHLNPNVRCTSNAVCQAQGLGTCVPPPGTCTNFGTCQDLAYSPSARSGHTAVWTGSEMIVWGGGSNTGGRFNPVSNIWTPTSTGTNVPSARSSHAAVWTGSEMIVWGGGPDQTGGRYNPVTDLWAPTSTANAPSARSLPTAVWTGSEMIVWGGSGTNTGGRYNPVSNTWMATSTGANVPSGRSNHRAVWSGSEMIVWGGLSGSAYQYIGGRYCASSACSVGTWFRDADGDGRGLSADSVLSCSQPNGYVAQGGDCNDGSAGVWATPGPVANLTASKNVPSPGMLHLSWNSLDALSGPATGCDVARGPLSVLHSGGGGGGASCASNNFPDTPYAEALSACGAPAGDGCWYLVRGQNACGTGSYGVAGIDGAGPCP